jgi:hypothetical protein
VEKDVLEKLMSLIKAGQTEELKRFLDDPDNAKALSAMGAPSLGDFLSRTNSVDPRTSPTPRRSDPAMTSR